MCTVVAADAGVAVLQHATGEERVSDLCDDGAPWAILAHVGGAFGSFQGFGRHFFHEQMFVYQELARIIAIRNSRISLRRGRQYLREIAGYGIDFGLPQIIGGEIRSIVPWSRIMDQSEVLCAINTDYNQPTSAMNSGLRLWRRRR